MTMLLAHTPLAAGARSHDSPVLRRKCACEGSGHACADCDDKKKLQRNAIDGAGSTLAPPIVHEVLRTPGEPLDASTRLFMETRFGHDFGTVRVHADPRAGQSARAVRALAYTVGPHVVFRSGQYAPHTDAGKQILAHELAHVLQQGAWAPARIGAGLAIASSTSPDEASADRISRQVLESRGPVSVQGSFPAVQRRAAPYIKKVTVHLTPPQTAELAWDGGPPADAPGTDSFPVSTGKGYGDPDDPPGTCTRSCCKDPMTQCAPPWNRPDKVGACCTYYGDDFWTGTPLAEHNTWKWWTPVQPYYGSRGIALHQHPEVTGQPIGHGCVRMEEANAKRIHDFSNGRQTNVTIDGRAAPVACADERKCTSAQGSSGARGALEGGEAEEALASAAIPGLEGVMS